MKTLFKAHNQLNEDGEAVRAEMDRALKNIFLYYCHTKEFPIHEITSVCHTAVESHATLAGVDASITAMKNIAADPATSFQILDAIKYKQPEGTSSWKTHSKKVRDPQ
jgi:hypothetical protein